MRPPHSPLCDKNETNNDNIEQSSVSGNHTQKLKQHTIILDHLACNTIDGAYNRVQSEEKIISRKKEQKICYYELNIRHRRRSCWAVQRNLIS